MRRKKHIYTYYRVYQQSLGIRLGRMEMLGAQNNKEEQLLGSNFRKQRNATRKSISLSHPSFLREKKEGSHHIISYYIIFYHTKSYIILHHISDYIILHHIISYYIILYHIISHYIILYHIISYYIILYHIIPYYIILYHIIMYYNYIYLSNII